MVQAQVGVHLFEPLVLGLQFLETALGIVLVGDFFLLPLIEGGGADLVFTAQFGDRHAGVVFGDDAEEVVSGKFAPTHCVRNLRVKKIMGNFLRPSGRSGEEPTLSQMIRRINPVQIDPSGDIR